MRRPWNAPPAGKSPSATAPGQGLQVKPISSVERAVAAAGALPAPVWPERGVLAAQLLAGLGWLAAYVGLEWISFIHEYKGLPVTPWNPGLGAMVALMILSGKRYAIVLFAGVLIAEFVV